MRQESVSVNPQEPKIFLTKHSLEISKVIPASRSQVFEAWTNPTILEKWLSPEECHLDSYEGDVEVGKDYKSSMTCDNKVHTNFGTYKEIIPNEKLVFTHQWEEPYPVETTVTVEFKEHDLGTEMIFNQEGFEDPEEAKGHSEGWASAFNNLIKQLSY